MKQNFLLIAVAAAGCTNSPMMPAATGPTALFAPPAVGPPDLSSVPWPSDLYLDTGGHLAIASLTPLQITKLTPLIVEDLGRHDGFPVTSGAFFPTSGPIDSASLDGHVRLLDLDGGLEVPVLALFRADDQLIHARPQNGHVLLQKHRYAYVLTTGLTSDTGAPIGPSDDFRAVRDATSRPMDARLGRTWDKTKPLLDLLDKGSPGRAEIIAAAVFTTQSVTRDLQAIRAALAAGPVPSVRIAYVFAATKTADDDGSLEDLLGLPVAELPGGDNPGGIAHDGISYVIHGSYDSPDFLAATTSSPDPKRGTTTLTGRITFADDGTSKPQGIGSVPFTLVLPKTPSGGSYAKLPTVIFTHGLGGNRDAVLMVANTIAREGYAVIGIDIPFHGMRMPNPVDAVHNFTGAPGPDGLVDSGGDKAQLAFFDVGGDAMRDVLPLDPSVIRGSFQQATADILSEVRVITEGNFGGPVGARDARLASLSLSPDKVMYSGESFGSIIGGLVIAVEPKLGAAVLAVGGGGLVTPLLTWSVDFGPIFGVLLDGALGTNASSDPPESDFGYNLIEFLLEGADPLAFSPYVILHPLDGAKPRHVVLLQARLDEAVPNIAAEALAGGMGLEPARTSASGTISYDWTFPAPTVKQSPIMGNVQVAGVPVTAAIIQFDPAFHGMFTNQKGVRRDDASKRPFMPLPTPLTIAGPIEALHAIYSEFAADFFNGAVPAIK